MLVCDASLVVELCLDRIGERADEALGEEELVAPPLLWSEVPSVLNEMAFRGTISRGLAEQGLERFLGRQIAIAERRPDGLTTTAWRLAGELGWDRRRHARTVRGAPSGDRWQRSAGGSARRQ